MSNAAVINATNASGWTVGSPITIETGGDVVLKAYGTGSGSWSVTLSFAPVVGGVTGSPTTLTIGPNAPSAKTSVTKSDATQWVGWVSQAEGTWEASGLVEGYTDDEALANDLGYFASSANLPTKALKLGAKATLPSGPVTWRGAGAGGWVGETKISRTQKVCSVATRSAFPFLNTFGTAKQFMSRTGYRATANVSAFQLTFVNWSTNGDAEVVGSQPATVKAAIEYPLGTIAAIVTFSGGSQTGVMAAGSSIISDMIALDIKYGELFAVRSFLDAPGGAPYYGAGPNAFSTAVDSSQFGTTATDVTYTTSAIPNSQNGLHYRPSLITGYSDSLSALLIGDSRMCGINDVASDASGETGQIARGLYPVISTINIGSPGSTIAGFLNGSGYAKRLAAIAGMYDIAISNLGVNDILSAISVNIILSQLNSLPAIVGKPMWQCTIPPVTTSSDSWTTVANQTANGNNNNRVSLNNSIRAGALSNFRGILEIADIVESSRNSGKWKADGVTANLYTADGLHETQFANLTIKANSELPLFLATVLN